jgi:hypothetical protein
VSLNTVMATPTSKNRSKRKRGSEILQLEKDALIKRSKGEDLHIKSTSQPYQAQLTPDPKPQGPEDDDFIALLLLGDEISHGVELNQLIQTGLDGAEESHVTESSAPNDPTGMSAISSADFVDHFSMINIVWLARKVPDDRPAPLTWQNAVAAGLDPTTSVTPPIQFNHWCTYQDNGCQYSTSDKFHMSTHNDVCAFKDGKPTTKHWKTSHSDWPKTCTCSETTMYFDKDNLRAHCLLEHPAKAILPDSEKDFSCPVSDCIVTKTANNYIRAHLRHDHQLLAVEVDRLCPNIVCNSRRCLFPGCVCRERFGRKDYYKHLEIHGVFEEWEKKEYTRERALGLEPPMASHYVSLQR